MGDSTQGINRNQILGVSWIKRGSAAYKSRTFLQYYHSGHCKNRFNCIYHVSNWCFLKCAVVGSHLAMPQLTLVSELRNQLLAVLRKSDAVLGTEPALAVYKDSILSAVPISPTLMLF